MQVKGWTCRDTSPADYSASGWDASGPARFLRGRMLCLAKGWKSVKKCCDDGRGAGPALTNQKKCLRTIRQTREFRLLLFDAIRNSNDLFAARVKISRK
jgi:hypothetical protein